MKTLAKILFLSLILGFMTMCSKSDDPTSSNDPNEFCTGGLCDNSAGRQQCIKSYEDCTTIGATSDDECKAIALGVCNL